MLTVAADELPPGIRANLTSVLAGERISITDHGRTVATLRVEPSIVRPAPGRRRSDSQQVPPVPGLGMPASLMVCEDRR